MENKQETHKTVKENIEEIEQHIKKDFEDAIDDIQKAEKLCEENPSAIE